jgi:protein-ribulosamine 3-kinase
MVSGLSPNRPMPQVQMLAAAIADVVGVRVAARPLAGVHGGSINQCVRWESDGGTLFVKIGSASSLEMFEAEAEGLTELRRADALHVPAVRGCGLAGDTSFLALDWVEFGSNSTRSETLLGERLARLHRVTAPRYGWHRDNTIGATPQLNEWSPDWPRFFCERRLGFQLDLAERQGHGGRLVDRGRRLCERIDRYFDGYRPAASLLHGDLWGGNWATDASGEPVIFDPAVYYGDREADLAMTRLFGGFGRAFHSAYEHAWPLDPGSGERVALYNLYHVLNHLNLFGGGYRAQAEGMIDRLLAATR